MNIILFKFLKYNLIKKNLLFKMLQKNNFY